MAKEQLSEKELREKIEAEIRAKLADEQKEKDEKAAKEKEELEKKLASHEANLEKQIRDQEKSLKDKLKTMKKVSIEIPEDPNNPDDVVPVTWNGITYAIPRGRQFEVPEAIYNVWKESHERTKAVNKRIRESSQKEIMVY